jgi:hypothetical protein
MPEDIPEELELKPEPPEPPQIQPAAKPDYSFFTAILGIVLAVLIPILQMNGVAINWQFSAICYAIIIVGIIWTFLAHGVPHCRKSIRIAGSIVIFACAGYLAVLGTHRQYYNQHHPIIYQSDTNILAAVSGVGSTVTGLEHVLSSNLSVVPDARLAFLNREQQEAIQEEKEIQNRHEIKNVEAVNLNSIRMERDGELSENAALNENQKKQAAIQQQIDDINNAQRAQENAISEQENKKKTAYQLLLLQKGFSKPILPIFDYVINGRDKILTEVGNSEKKYSDFPGTAASIYASNLEKDGVVTNGRNSISLGTNAAWNFEISTALVPIDDEGRFQLDNSAPVFASLKIVSRTTNGESVLIVTPTYQNNALIGVISRRRIIPHRTLTNVISQLLVSSVEVKLTVPNGLNVDENNSTNYTEAVDRAIRHLIAAQDQQCPLMPKGGN